MGDGDLKICRPATTDGYPDELLKILPAANEKDVIARCQRCKMSIRLARHEALRCIVQGVCIVCPFCVMGAMIECSEEENDAGFPADLLVMVGFG